MIEVTRLDGARIVVNSDLIEIIEATPDTIISLTNGRKLIVKESVADVVERVVEFRQRVFPSRRQRAATGHPETA